MCASGQASFKLYSNFQSEKIISRVRIRKGLLALKRGSIVLFTKVENVFSEPQIDAKGRVSPED
jgi:hypothetical protein